MSSLNGSTTMGAPTLHRRASQGAPLLAVAALGGAGLLLSSSHHLVAQFAGAAAGATALAVGWFAHRRLVGELVAGEAARASLRQSGEDAILLLRPCQPVEGRSTGYEIAYANEQARRLYGCTTSSRAESAHDHRGHGGGPAPMSRLDDVLPAAFHGSLHHKLALAASTRQTQAAQYGVSLNGVPQGAMGLHHRIIPVGEVMLLVSRDTSELRGSGEPSRTQTHEASRHRSPVAGGTDPRPITGDATGQTDGQAADQTVEQTCEQLRLASRVINETGDAVVVSDAVDRIVMANPAFLHLTGLSPSEVIGRSAELLGLAPLRESHLPGVTHALRTGRRWSGESRQVCGDGQAVDVWMSVSTLRNERQKVTQHVRVFSDISVLKAQQRELVEQARHDSLTGLPNRRAFGERLNQAMARARRHPQTLAVLYVDLDGFKAVNDRCGHAAGDKLLIEVAKRLLQCVRLTDCVCRLGGDEFTVILEGAGHPGEVVRICQRILDKLCLPHEVAGDALVVSPSIGAAVYESSESTEALCQRADAAMYTAKHRGKANFVVAGPGPAQASA